MKNQFTTNLSCGLFFTLLSTFLFQPSALGQYLEWAIGVTSNNDVETIAVTTDTTGNVYSAGYYWGTVDFDPGPDVYELSSASRPGFILKLDPQGNFLWVKSFDGVSHTAPTSITLDTEGNIVSMGTFSNDVDFDPGPEEFILSADVSKDVYILKMNPDGNFIWAKSFGNTITDDVVCDVKTDAENNVYALGRFRYTVDFDPGPEVFEMDAETHTDVFILKLDTDGNFVWAKETDYINTSYRGALALDDENNVYIAGPFGGVRDFDPGPGEYLLYSYEGSGMYMQKLTSDGNFVWAKAFGGDEEDFPLDMEVAPSGNIYFTGYHRGDTDFDPGPYVYNLPAVTGSDDIFIVRFSPECELDWAVSIGYLGDDIGYGIELDEFENVYVAGRFRYTQDFDPGPDTLLLYGGGAFVEKLDSSGQFLYAFSVVDSDAMGFDIACQSHDVLYLVGRFKGAADFDSGPPSYMVYGDGWLDGYTAKYTACGYIKGKDSVTVCDTYTVPSGDETYTNSGVYNDTLPNIHGCDSVITIKLNINQSITHKNVTVCDTYTVPSGDETYFESGVYQDTLSTYLGCDSVLILTVTVNDFEIEAFSDLDSVYTEIEGAAYQWLHCDLDYLPIVDADEMVYHPLLNGNYAVAVTQEGCQDTSNCVTIVGLSTPEEQSSFNCYPNPTNGSVRLSWNGNKPKAIFVKNSLGQIIHSYQEIPSNELQLDLPLANGIYLLEIKSSTGKSTFIRVMKV